ncbi:MAG: hypothetical protein JJ979_26395 [Roseibium sp.]|nr:hypothetical protein [Roseibium sp.]
MVSSFWMAIAAIAIVAIIIRGVVEIIKVSKAPGAKSSDRIKSLEEDVAELEHELKDMRKRIEVLETIVTDGKYNLGKQIDDLAAG